MLAGDDESGQSFARLVSESRLAKTNRIEAK
jgi:hypothetical protein